MSFNGSTTLLSIGILTIPLCLGCARLSGVDELTFDRGREQDASTIDAVDEEAAVEDVGVEDVGIETGTDASLVPTLGRYELWCKLINDEGDHSPTANDTHFRANLSGSSLGIPVVHGNDTFFFFGDTAGSQKIWPRKTASLPNSIGYSAVPYAEVRANPELLCSNLRFLLSGKKSGNVEGDFAGVTMKAPAGKSLSDFIRNPAGPYEFFMQSNMPGNIEVPSGGFSHDGAVYGFFTIANLSPLDVRGAYLAKWITPSTMSKPEFQILHRVDQRFDENGPLRGNFINISPLLHEEYLYLYGTGKYRKSPVYLARKRLSLLEVEGGFEIYDAAMSAWVPSNKPAAPIVAAPNVGELSVRYFADVDKYVMLYQEIDPIIRIVARFASKPEGPWSDAITVASMADPLFVQKHCCDANKCIGEQIIHCGRAGFFGTYMLPDIVGDSRGQFTILFTMSTWDPYNVVLMSATFE